MADTWIENAGVQTNRVVRYGIAIGTELARPDVSTLGLGDTISASWPSGWTELDFYIKDDDMDLQAVPNADVRIQPVQAPGKIALIRGPQGIDKIMITSEEVGAKLLAWATNHSEVDPTTGVATPGSGYHIETQTYTRCALALEVAGVGIWWFPSVEIKVAPPKTNVKNPATAQVEIEVFCVTSGTKDITHAFLEYQAA